MIYFEIKILTKKSNIKNKQKVIVLIVLITIKIKMDIKKVGNYININKNIINLVKITIN